MGHVSYYDATNMTSFTWGFALTVKADLSIEATGTSKYVALAKRGLQVLHDGGGRTRRLLNFFENKYLQLTTPIQNSFSDDEKRAKSRSPSIDTKAFEQHCVVTF
jgi:hypothetical protein